MNSTLQSAATDADFSLLLESPDGRSYRFSRGGSTSTTSYESASTSKLVTAVAILSLIDHGTTTLTLDSKPQDFISFWTPAAGSPASRVTLRHLLSFTSGFMKEPEPVPPALLGCIDRPSGNFESCVLEIYNSNIQNDIEPGSQYYYSSAHLQIAGLMAIEAGGFSDWNALFYEFKARTGLFGHSAYDLPSSANPRLAGGMHWTGEDYVTFLKALYSGNLLSAAMNSELWANQRSGAAVIHSPVLNAMGEDWGYGLGNWVECRSISFDCTSAPRRNSSPGAYGAYPFVDVESHYVGILARQGALGTFPNGIDLFRGVQDSAAKWAALSCVN